MNKRCKCSSWAINERSNGREPGVDLDLCDVCYWRKRAEATQAIQQDLASDLVQMPRRLTAENGAKGALSCEFAEKMRHYCTTCDHDEPDDGCEECDGRGSFLVDVPVEWDTIKRIYKAAVALLGTPPAAQPSIVSQMVDALREVDEYYPDNAGPGFLSVARDALNAYDAAMAKGVS